MSSPSTTVIDAASPLPVPLVTLPALAREINDAHRQVSFHARSMLDEARRAGEALIAAKKLVPHGGWRLWVEAHCAFSYRTAAAYMRAASLIKVAGPCTFDGSLEAFLEAHSSRRLPTPPDASRPSFDRSDAEHALKLKAMADRGGTENERQVAESKLEAFAQGFGLTGAEAVLKAAEVAPDQTLTTTEATKQGLKADILKPFTGMSKDELLDTIFDLILKLSRETRSNG